MSWKGYKKFSEEKEPDLIRSIKEIGRVNKALCILELAFDG